MLDNTFVNSLDLLLGLKYLYATVWKNVGMLNYDLFFFFLRVFNIVASVLLGLVMLFSRKYFFVRYHFCAGTYPSKGDKSLFLFS